MNEGTQPLYWMHKYLSMFVKDNNRSKGIMIIIYTHYCAPKLIDNLNINSKDLALSKDMLLNSIEFSILKNLQN